MISKNDFWDNAVAKSFFKTLKDELIYQTRYETKSLAALEIFEYIEVWYNKKRRLSAIGYNTPEEYGAKLLINKKVA